MFVRDDLRLSQPRDHHLQRLGEPAPIIDLHHEHIRHRRDEAPHLQTLALDHTLGVLERKPLPEGCAARCKRLAAELHRDSRNASAVIRGAAPLAGHALMVTIHGEDIDPVDLEMEGLGRSPDHRPHATIADGLTRIRR